ncbi:G-alpha-domain-containing protein [Gloeophyllum trabeum ATCC 11539]|uniref:G-alpha-domain-containing protein n=1 Tax=Gloeophyllum trabeum (strain ATCC 11539 / FP-39264 / Madison 617) TaxID=670483 RepID=S7QJZ0_GLOTA|nr:G-alpha-domain-containing protein [Gloeophyllum trabeum ATCC 11539]EPQ60031.1 G-alpha-domain-containing protein [Gloeophyllum trabeum ATCC 11539]
MPAAPKLEPNRRRSLSDPFERVMQPPEDETMNERERRLQAEAHAKKVSDGIDEMIRQERKERMKKKEVKVLLLGQSESGKSTTLKRDATGDDAPDDAESVASLIISSNGNPRSYAVPNYERYASRLAPLTRLEERLSRQLSSPDEDEPTHTDPAYASASASSVSLAPTSPASMASEVSVHTHSNWKKVFSFGGRPKGGDTNELVGWWEDPDDPCHVLYACAPAMMELWRDKTVRWILDQKRIRLEESSGFYLDEIDRITAKKYIPTDEDVLKARLKTLGVIEHSFMLSHGLVRGVEWKIYDVGGARSQRQAWAPYFEDVNAIIFLAPISAFDQALAEDPRVNRLEDSLLLWKSVVSNKLLANVNIVLFLNKCDLLKAKLESGIQLNQHLFSYGDRPNDYESVRKYFYNKFGLMHQNHTPNRDRELYIHFTSVTDTRRTHTIINNVRDIILKANLKDIQLI